MESLCKQAKDWSTFVITYPSQTQDNHSLQKGFNGIGQAVGLSGTELEKFSQVIKLQLSILFMFIRSWWSYSHRTSHYLYQAWTWRYVLSYMSRGCQTTLKASGAALRTDFLKINRKEDFCMVECMLAHMENDILLCMSVCVSIYVKNGQLQYIHSLDISSNTLKICE